MKFYIIIPAHNEAQFIGKTLHSLVNQSLKPEKIVVVDDASTDETHTVVEGFLKTHNFVSLIHHSASKDHLPGSKVIQAFNKGLKSLDRNYDVLCKFDADLIFPSKYLETLAELFQKNKNIGMAGGFCSIQKNGSWKVENLTDNEHIRGALKAYRKQCFADIGHLKPAMGWDTLDELLARYHGWEIKTEPGLLVKHLKPTGQTYHKKSKLKQGEAFYRLDYGFFLTFVASAKLALLKKNASFFKDYLEGYFKAKKEKRPLLVSPLEGRFIRKYRWKKIRQKIFS